MQSASRNRRATGVGVGTSQYQLAEVSLGDPDASPLQHRINSRGIATACGCTIAHADQRNARTRGCLGQADWSASDPIAVNGKLQACRDYLPASVIYRNQSGRGLEHCKTGRIGRIGHTAGICPVVVGAGSGIPDARTAIHHVIVRVAGTIPESCIRQVSDQIDLTRGRGL
ncbi:hypothetical protein DP49_5693 [Burkholderia pseudomallei]|nr:hypothetical protein DP49_5693 [Burkholderia pseudomallei]